MNDDEIPTLPGVPGPRLRAAWEDVRPGDRGILLKHLLGETSAEYLADWFGRRGTPVSATTIRTYRRAIRRSGV